MNQDLNTAFIVFLVGMTTVFLILALVVLTGKLLINIINRFYPLPVIGPTSESRAEIKNKSIKAKQLAVIVAAVEAITGGKGKVESITKEQ